MGTSKGFVLVGLFLVAGYFASYGPVAVLRQQGFIADRSTVGLVRGFYSPINGLRAISPGFDRAMNGYLYWWIHGERVPDSSGDPVEYLPHYE